MQFLTKYVRKKLNEFNHVHLFLEGHEEPSEKGSSESVTKCNRLKLPAADG
jgi:hypothetical protein